MISMYPFSNMHGFTIKLNILMRQEVIVPPVSRPKDNPVNNFQEVLTSQMQSHFWYIPLPGLGVKVEDRVLLTTA